MSEQDPRCKTCGGDVIVVLKRAWCIGGCGSFWKKDRGGRWVLRYDYAKGDR